MGIDSALFPYRSVSAGGDSEGANVPLSGFDHHDPIWCYQKQRKASDREPTSFAWNNFDSASLGKGGRPHGNPFCPLPIHSDGARRETN